VAFNVRRLGAVVALQVYNVRTRRKEPFVPLHAGGPVGLYVCGLTVYDHAHIGHARTYVAFDVIRGWLEHRFGRVHHVQNVTDVDDKIIARAAELGQSPRFLAEHWDGICRRMMKRLGIRVPDAEDSPHVTQSIPDIIAFVQDILRNGFAYATPEGNVYFDVPKYDAHAAGHFKDDEGRRCGYGTLSNRDFREMAAGTRKEVEGDKRHPADFALWKCADPGDHEDANWDSPWGRGRPGWHIECSLMSTRALGDQFDIHGGGQDLIFPHHENEIAQSQAKTGKAPFVRYWLHSGFLNVEGEKMSKSLGNFITLQSALEELDAKHGDGVGADVLRFYFIQTHYRSKIDYQHKGLDEAAKSLASLRKTLDFLGAAAAKPRIGCAEMDVPMAKASEHLRSRFDAAMDDDFHTPGALAALFDFQREANRLLDTQGPTRPLGSAAASDAAAAMASCCKALMILPERPATGAGSAPAALQAAAAQLGIELEASASEASLMAKLIEAREAARAAKDWARSDAIRSAAKAAGYLIEDASGGQRWRKL
jgi:cysteinyl-tRNA synthetase